MKTLANNIPFFDDILYFVISMEFHTLEFTYFELKYLLEYLQDNAAKQVYITNCLSHKNLNEISKRISYLVTTEEVIKECIVQLLDSDNEFNVTVSNRKV